MANNKFRTLVKRILLISKLKLVAILLNEYGLKWIILRITYAMSQKVGYKSKIMPIRNYEDFKSSSKIIPNHDAFKTILKSKFVDMDVHNISKFYNNLNDIEKSNILNKANKLERGIICGFGKIDLDYGQPLSWFFNPISKKLFNSEDHWSKIPDFGFPGDIKLGWEVSRFHFVYDLIKAHAVSGDEKYYSIFIEKFEDWINQNQPERGINWKCSQEISIRLLSITYGFRYFCEYYHLSEDVIEKYFLLLDASLNHIFINKSYALKSIKNDHAIVEMFTLYLFGPISINTKHKRFQQYGSIQFEKQILDQIYLDGGYKQNSFNYHRLILQVAAIYIHHKRDCSPKVYDRVSKSIHFLNSAIMNKNGNVPNFGPSDSAFIFPYSNDINNYRKTLNLCNYLVSGKIVYNELADFEDISWFVASEPAYEIDNYKSEESFNTSGYWYLKNEIWNVFFRAGKQWHRPFHDDMMHVDIWYKGINVLCDMGTYSYNFISDDSDYYSSNLAHNTLSISPTNKFSKIGKFLITNWKHAENTFRESHMIYAEQYFDKNTKHQRKVEIEHDAVVIEDVLKTKEKKDVSISFNSGFENITKVNDYMVHISNSNGDVFELSFSIDPNTKATVDIKKANENSAIGWYSGSYLDKNPAIHMSLIFICENEVKILSKLTKIS